MVWDKLGGNVHPKTGWKEKKAPRQNQLVPKKGHNQNLRESQKRMLGCFSSVEKGEAFSSAFCDSLYLSKNPVGFLEGGLRGAWELKLNSSRERICFRKGSTQLLSGAEDTSQGWIVRTVSSCRYWPAAPFAHPDSRAEAVFVLCAGLTYLSLAAPAGVARILWS